MKCDHARGHVALHVLRQLVIKVLNMACKLKKQFFALKYYFTAITLQFVYLLWTAILANTWLAGLSRKFHEILDSVFHNSTNVIAFSALLICCKRLHACRTSWNAYLTRSKRPPPGKPQWPSQSARCQARGTRSPAHWGQARSNPLPLWQKSVIG